MVDKEQIIKKLCYTELVYGRINKKLNTRLSKQEIEVYIMNLLKDTNEGAFVKIGKNYYALNEENNIRITINSNTYRIITVDRISRG